MAHAEICPVCKGGGKIWLFPSTAGTSSSAPVETACHGCAGLGWVTVADPGDCAGRLPTPAHPEPI